jgi:HEAT repeat protein
MWRRLSLSLLLPLALLTPSAARAADDEPVIQNKTLSEWLEMLKGDKARADRDTALFALGSAAAHPGAWKHQARLREAGLLAVSLIGPQKSPKVLPALLDALHNDSDESIRRGAAQSLGRLGAKVHEDNASASRKINLADVRDGLAVGLDKDKSPKVREACARALGLLLEEPGRTVPELAAALKDPDGATQAAAADSVRRFSESKLLAPREALPQLEAALKDPKTNTLARVRLAITIGMIGQQPATSVNPKVLIDVLNEEGTPEELRVAIVETLGRLGPALVREGDRGAVEALTKVLGDTKSALEMRRACLGALDNFGAAARPALPLLGKGLKDKDKFVRTLSMHVIGHLGRDLGPEGKEIVKELLKITGEAAFEVRVSAIETLGNLGADALGDELPAVLDRLTELTKDTQRGVREAAEEARKKLKQTP